MDYLMLYSGGYEREFRDRWARSCRDLDLNLLLVYGSAIDEPTPWCASYNALFDHLNSDRVDGLIALSACLAAYCGPEGVAQFLQRFRGKPLCSVGMDLPGVPSVVVDNRLGMQAVVEHMVRDHGCRRVAFLAGTAESPEAKVRLQV